MRKEIIERLKTIGVSIHKGGFECNLIDAMSGYRPVCALWYESEEPTEEEITILERIVAKKLSSFDREEVKGLAAEGANTVTLKKENGEWMFRRLTWTQRPLWSPKSSSLALIENEIA